MRRLMPFALLLASALPNAAIERPVHTYSIVARDGATGQLGVAVQSHWFSVGSIVTWAEAGVGAIATQSFVDPAYGPRGLDLMKSGLSAEQALEALVLVDEGRDVRQVAFVDADGRVAAHTGVGCIEAAGHYVGEGYSVQANMMLNERVVPAMAKAFEATDGDLASRLMAALEAAQEAGGDIRGRQSAAMLIVEGEGSGRPWSDRVVDLRIEDHAEPILELRRLLTVHRAYEHMNAGDVAVEKGDSDLASQEYGAAGKLLPESLEVRYWHAVTLATTGELEASLPIFREVFAADANWAELTRRLFKPGIIPDTSEGHAMVDRILREAEDAHFTRPKDGARMVLVPAGAPGESAGGQPAFLIDETEITQRRYLGFVDEEGVALPGLPRVKQADDHPVVGVPWHDAAAYCRWVGARLPSESEWERAAGREESGGGYPWGESWVRGRANFATGDDGFICTAPVGSFPDGASPFGVLDLAGNAEEWVDGKTETGQRIARGGSWRSRDPEELRLDRRVLLGSDEAGQWVGFRCAADVPVEVPKAGAGPATTPEEGP